MVNIHYNNNITSRQSFKDVAESVLKQILKSNDTFQISIDDGDGDVWKYTIDVSCERIKPITGPITEN